jgi:hypothetical protein
LNYPSAIENKNGYFSLSAGVTDPFAKKNYNVNEHIYWTFVAKN